MEKLTKGQSAKVKAFTPHFPLKKERNFNSYDVIAEQEKVLIFTGFAFAKVCHESARTKNRERHR
jgi:hypothetical protein